MSEVRPWTVSVPSIARQVCRRHLRAVGRVAHRCHDGVAHLERAVAHADGRDERSIDLRARSFGLDVARRRQPRYRGETVRHRRDGGAVQLQRLACPGCNAPGGTVARRHGMGEHQLRRA